MKLEYIPQIDAKMYLRDHTDLWGWYQNNEYEPHETELVKKIVKKDWVCIDVGANIGYYSILMAKLGAQVHSWEAEQSNYGMLFDNFAINNLRGVKLWPPAIVTDHTNPQEKLYLCNKSHGMHRAFPSKHCDGYVYCRAVMIDDYELEPDFIKIDVEGSEFQVLNGMRKTIYRDKPIMLIEFHPPTLQEAGTNGYLIYAMLKDMGYKITLVHPYTEIKSYEQLYHLTNNESGGQNILCQ